MRIAVSYGFENIYSVATHTHTQPLLAAPRTATARDVKCPTNFAVNVLATDNRIEFLNKGPCEKACDKKYSFGYKLDTKTLRTRKVTDLSSAKTRNTIREKHIMCRNLYLCCICVYSRTSLLHSTRMKSVGAEKQLWVRFRFSSLFRFPRVMFRKLTIPIPIFSV